jgi:hypothetical protein
MMPQLVQTMRGPNAGTVTSLSKASTFITAWWWHSSQVTQSERTPFSRMSASVIGGPRYRALGMVIASAALLAAPAPHARDR